MKTLKTSLLCFVVTLTIFNSGCKSVKALVNNKYEPLTTTDQQIRAIQESKESLSEITPSLGIRINEAFVSNFLETELIKFAQDYKDNNIILHSLKSKISLEKQAIVVSSNFEASLKELQIKIDGKIEGYLGLFNKEDTLYFLPAFKTLKVNHISFTNKKPKLQNRAIASIIVPLTTHFLDNINGLIMKKIPAINTNWGTLTDINLGYLFSNDETNITTTTTQISRYAKATSWLVDKNGVSVIVELSKDKTNQQKNASVDLNGQEKGAELESSYNELRDEFAKKWLSKLEPYKNDSKLVVSVNKSALASIFNDALNTTDFEIVHTISIPKTESKDDLEIDRLKLDCNSVREPFNFPAFSYSANCDYSCMKTIKVKIGPIKITKRIDDPVCGAARTACKVARESARVAWQTARESARIAHQAYNEGKVAACKIAVEASELVDLGKIETSSQGQGTAKINLNNLKMNDDLTSLSFNSKGDVNVKLNSFMGLYPQDVGHLLLCITDYKKRISTNLKGDITSQFNQINFVPEKKGDILVLTGEVSPISYSVKADVSPLHQLLLDPELAVKCRLLYSTLFVGGTIGGVAAVLGMIKNPELQLLLKGNAIGNYQLKPFTQNIPPIEFELNNNEKIKSNIEWTYSSINFVY